MFNGQISVKWRWINFIEYVGNHCEISTSINLRLVYVNNEIRLPAMYLWSDLKKREANPRCSKQVDLAATL